MGSDALPRAACPAAFLSCLCVQLLMCCTAGLQLGLLAFGAICVLLFGGTGA
jgi:hypothetical protein